MSRLGGYLVLDLGEQPPATISRGVTSWTRPGIPAADVAVLIVRPGPVPGRSHDGRGTEGHRACCPRRPGRPGSGPVGLAGFLPEKGMVAEYGSPHGGSWLGLSPSAGSFRPTAARLTDHRLLRLHARRGPASGPGRARDQGRARRRPLLQYHALSTSSGSSNGTRSGNGISRLLDDRADRHAGHRRLQPADRLAVRSVRRDRLAGRGPGRRTGTGPTRGRGLCSRTRPVGVRDPGAEASLQRDVQSCRALAWAWTSCWRLAKAPGSRTPTRTSSSSRDRTTSSGPVPGSRSRDAASKTVPP